MHKLSTLTEVLTAPAGITQTWKIRGQNVKKYSVAVLFGTKIKLAH